MQQYDLMYAIFLYFLVNGAACAPQVSKGLAYPVNGIVMGGSDWGFLTASMWFCNLCCCSVVFACKPVQTIATIWVGLAVFMTTQCLTGLARIGSGTGVWRAVKPLVKASSTD